MNAKNIPYGKEDYAVADWWSSATPETLKYKFYGEINDQDIRHVAQHIAHMCKNFIYLPDKADEFKQMDRYEIDKGTIDYCWDRVRLRLAEVLNQNGVRVFLCEKPEKTIAPRQDNRRRHSVHYGNVAGRPHLQYKYPDTPIHMDPRVYYDEAAHPNVASERILAIDHKLITLRNKKEHFIPLNEWGGIDDIYEYCSIVANILNGVRALHHAGIAHNDIKPENILLSINAGKLTAQLADLEFFTRNTDQLTGVTLEFCDAHFYYKYRNESFQEKSPATDIFSLGATLYVLTAKFIKHNHRQKVSLLKPGNNIYTEEEDLAKQIKTELAAYPQIADLICAMTACDRDRRPNINQVIERFMAIVNELIPRRSHKKARFA